MSVVMPVRQVAGPGGFVLHAADGREGRFHVEQELNGVEEELQRILLEIPNMTLPTVPAGGEDASRVGER